jgi:hypothetical protein
MINAIPRFDYFPHQFFITHRSLDKFKIAIGNQMPNIGKPAGAQIINYNDLLMMCQQVFTQM